MQISYNEVSRNRAVDVESTERNYFMPLSKARLHCFSLNDNQNNSFKFPDMFCAEVYSIRIKNVEDPGQNFIYLLNYSVVFTAQILIYSQLVKKYGKLADLN